METQNETLEPAVPPKPAVPDIILTTEQQSALDTIMDWLKGAKQQFKLGGFAGTGKTTLNKSVVAACNKAGIALDVCAFTGKAVNVLHRKGVQACTMHSLMYDVIDLGKGVIAFEKKTKLEGRPKLVIVDEASMVSTELFNDLISFGTKCLFVGDPGQLEPVGDNPQLMMQPDITLQTIHRQAENSPIIKLANWVRKGGAILGSSHEDLVVMTKAYPIDKASAHDQIICAKNATRLKLNKAVREYRQLPLGKLVLNEKIIVLKNNINYGVFNGMIMFVRNITDEDKDFYICNCEDEVGRKFHDLPIWKQPFENPDSIKNDSVPPKYMTDSGKRVNSVYATFGYVITCHKSQGSEWNNVLVWDEWMPPHIWDMKRWRYTAITRAAKKLTYCL